MSWTGKIKDGYFKKWMRVRYALEIRVDIDGSSSSISKNIIIECPRLHDVIFRRGTSLSSYPGNIMLRGLIETKFKAQEKTKTKRSKLVQEIIDEILGCERNTGRFLVWNDLGWWNVLIEEAQIYPKVEYLVKEFKKSMKSEGRKKKKSHGLNLKAGTFIFQSQDGGSTTAFGNNKRQRLSNSEDEDNENKIGTTETASACECFGMKFSAL